MTNNTIKYKIKKKELEVENIKYKTNIYIPSLIGFMAVIISIVNSFLPWIYEGIPIISKIFVMIILLLLLYFFIINDMITEISHNSKKITKLNGEIDSLYNNLYITKKKKKGKQ